ncbi:MAG: hypothetical protein QG671_556 [Actinomycetota bacterium]|nr:hypothetical protein [Actinomycetota bacterium]
MAVTWTVDDIPDQTGRTAVVTGASSGLGLITAAQLARHGATVLMAVRDVAKGERARTELVGDLEVHQLDLADLGSVRAFADTLHRQGRRIDVLVNNAGTGTAPQRQLSAQGHELIFATNHLGHFALTGLLLDLFRPGQDPRVVNVGSNLYRQMRDTLDVDDLADPASYSPGTAYVRSKVATVLFGAELDRRLRAAGRPVRSFLAHPGMANTPMHDAAHTFAQRAMVAITKPLLSRSAEHGALPLLFAATSPDAATGVFLGPTRNKRDLRVHFAPLVAPGDDLGAARRLWSLSEKLSGVPYLSSVPYPPSAGLDADPAGFGKSAPDGDAATDGRAVPIGGEQLR